MAGSRRTHRPNDRAATPAADVTYELSEDATCVVLTCAKLQIGRGGRIGVPYARAGAVGAAMRTAAAGHPPNAAAPPLVKARRCDNLLILSTSERLDRQDMRPVTSVAIPLGYVQAIADAIDRRAASIAAAGNRTRRDNGPAGGQTRVRKATACPWRSCHREPLDPVSGLCKQHYGVNRHYIRVFSGGSVGSNRRH